MLDTLGNIISSLFEFLLNKKQKPYISVLLYFVSGIIGGVCLISHYTPFCISSELIDSIVFIESLNDSQLIVQFTIILIMFRIVYAAFQSILLNQYGVSIDNHKWFVHIFTIGDLIDLLCSIASSLFMITVFIQMYHTGSVYLSGNAIVIYVWITYKFFAFIYVRYANKNVEIISNAITKYP